MTKQRDTKEAFRPTSDHFGAMVGPVAEVKSKTLPVFIVHDDPGGECHHEERWWAAIAAENKHDAMVVAVVVYSGDGPRRTARFFIDREHDVSSWPENRQPTYPQEIRDLRLLRLLGFSEPGELTCEECGLAANGIYEYAVCDECDMCRECGCTCEEDD